MDTGEGTPKIEWAGGYLQPSYGLWKEPEPQKGPSVPMVSPPLQAAQCPQGESLNSCY